MPSNCLYRGQFFACFLITFPSTALPLCCPEVNLCSWLRRTRAGEGVWPSALVKQNCYMWSWQLWGSPPAPGRVRTRWARAWEKGITRVWERQCPKTEPKNSQWLSVSGSSLFQDPDAVLIWGPMVDPHQLHLGLDEPGFCSSVRYWQVQSLPESQWPPWKPPGSVHAPGTWHFVHSPPRSPATGQALFQLLKLHQWTNQIKIPPFVEFTRQVRQIEGTLWSIHTPPFRPCSFVHNVFSRFLKR